MAHIATCFVLFLFFELSLVADHAVKAIDRTEMDTNFLWI